MITLAICCGALACVERPRLRAKVVAGALTAEDVQNGVFIGGGGKRRRHVGIQCVIDSPIQMDWDAPSATAGKKSKKESSKKDSKALSSKKKSKKGCR